MVILIIGILAAIALPNFLDTRDRAGDVRAKAAARSAATNVEACYVSSADYRQCTDATGLGQGGSVEFGTGAGQVQITAATKDEFQITGYSASGGEYLITRPLGGGPLVRTCKVVGACKTGKW